MPSETDDSAVTLARRYVQKHPVDVPEEENPVDDMVEFVEGEEMGFLPIHFDGDDGDGADGEGEEDDDHDFDDGLDDIESSDEQ